MMTGGTSAAIERSYKRWVAQDLMILVAIVVLALSSEGLTDKLDQWSQPVGGWADQALIVMVCLVPALVFLIRRGRRLLQLLKENDDVQRALFHERQRTHRMEGALVTVRTLHHEVNNPLQAIFGALELWDPMVGSREEQEEAWQMIHDASEEILDFTRRIGQISGEGELTTRPTSIGDLLDIHVQDHDPTRRETD